MVIKAERRQEHHAAGIGKTRVSFQAGGPHWRREFGMGDFRGQRIVAAETRELGQLEC